MFERFVPEGRTRGRVASRRPTQVVAAGNGSNSRPRQARPRGWPPHGMVLVATPQRQGRNWHPQGRQEANVTATPSAVTNRWTRPTVTTRNARSRKAREPPRSMRWCQRRCDRGIRARDPDVCCADALFPREEAETSKATTPCGWVVSVSSVAAGRRGLHHGPSACHTGAGMASPAAPSRAATPGIAAPTRRTDRASATALLHSSHRLWVFYPPGSEVSRPVECRARQWCRQRLSGGLGTAAMRWSNRGLHEDSVL
jgi:hypothetical protein